MKNILALLCFLPLAVMSQVSPNENYVHTTTYQEAVSETETTTAPEDSKIESVTYYDGLGRAKQSVQLRAGGNKEDIIVPVGRDGFGRTTKSYLPYAVGTNNGAYRNNALEELNSFYNTEKYEYTANPYSETITELSPLNRTEEVAAPGRSWAYDAANTTYENPVYISYPTTATYTGYWTAAEIFYGSDTGGGLIDADVDDPILIGVNFLSVHIANGTLRLRADLDKISNGTSLQTGKLRRMDVYPVITYFDMGAIKDKLGNDTEYRITIENNYLTIRKVNETSVITEGIAMDITYDLTQVQILSSYTNKYTTNHTTKASYGLNIADEVARFDVVITDGIPTLVANGYYPAGELTKVISKDENWTAADHQNRTTEGFTNKTGQTLLQRSYTDVPNNGNTAHDTYSVYDDFGNLTFVVPPKVDVTDGVSSSELAKLCYQYRYDERNRLVEKKIPGKGWEYIVYNRLDQPIMTQDALQKNRNEWSFVVYDTYGRVAYTGILQSSDERTALQVEADNSSNIYVHKQTTPVTIAGTMVYYSNDTYPTAISEIHTINYYDDYRFATAQEAAPSKVFGEDITTVTKSLPTGSKVRILDTNDWISSVIYYDDKARPIYSYSTNTYLNTIDHAKILYDFAGRTVKSRVSHTKDANTAIVTLDTFTYDHMGRLLTQKQQINSQPEEMIAHHNYDDLGQLESKHVGNTEQAPLQTVDYKYNVRGWLTDINDVNNIGNDLFSFRINYENPQHGAKALYNGNIASIDWKTANDFTQRWYTYDYDPMNRIKQAIDNADRYSLSNINYDKNSNILGLQRQGHTNAQATSFGTMDALTYDYGIGNTLEKVTDTSGVNFGFVDGSNTNIDYEYDINGNMTVDRNKGITDIKYNYMNLPVKVTFGNSGSRSKGIKGLGDGIFTQPSTITYTYNAAGTKLSKSVSGGFGASSKVIQYAGRFVYEKPSAPGGCAGCPRPELTLKFFNHSEGYIEPDGNGNFSYIYQFTDHLGNIRLSYSDKDGDGRVDVLRNNTDIDGDGDNAHEILAENNYYPFGLQHKGYNNTITGREHQYKYNGTELTEDLGYNMYEMPLRAYDPAIARWNRIDPVVHHGLSPYNAFDNNPVYYADPSGGDSWGISGGYHSTGVYSGGDDSAIFWGGADSFQNSGLDTDDIQNGVGMMIDAMAELGHNFTWSVDNNSASKKETWEAIAGDGKIGFLSLVNEFVQRYPDKIDFKNVKTKKDQEEFLNSVIEWFGFVNKFGKKLNIDPNTIIDFYADLKTEKTFSQKASDFFQDLIGGNSEDNNYVNIADGNGNSVRIGYFKHIQNHSELYTGNNIDFEGNSNILNKYRISIRSHDIGGGTPQAVIYMRFTGNDRSFYDQIARRINSYKYEKVKIIPYKKN